MLFRGLSRYEFLSWKEKDSFIIISSSNIFFFFWVKHMCQMWKQWSGYSVEEDTCFVTVIIVQENTIVASVKPLGNLHAAAISLIQEYALGSYPRFFINSQWSLVWMMLFFHRRFTSYLLFSRNSKSFLVFFVWVSFIYQCIIPVNPILLDSRKIKYIWIW